MNELIELLVDFITQLNKIEWSLSLNCLMPT